jgi:hypothetical protein
LDDRVIPSERSSDNCSTRPDNVPYRPNASQTKHHPSGRRALPSGPSIVSRRFYPACIRPDVSAAHPDASRTRPVSDSFQVPIKERSFNRLDDVVSRPDARLRKARIAIQISSSGRLSVLVQTPVQLIWKLSIRLQPSGRAHSRYENCVLKFSHPDAHSHGPDARSLIRKLLAADVQPSGQCAISSGRDS